VTLLLRSDSNWLYYYAAILWLCDVVRISEVSQRNFLWLPSLKLTIRTWKGMVGIRSFPSGMPLFLGAFFAVSFRERLVTALWPMAVFPKWSLYQGWTYLVLASPGDPGSPKMGAFWPTQILFVEEIGHPLLISWEYDDWCLGKGEHI